MNLYIWFKSKMYIKRSSEKSEMIHSFLSSLGSYSSFMVSLFSSYYFMFSVLSEKLRKYRINFSSLFFYAKDSILYIPYCIFQFSPHSVSWKLFSITIYRPSSFLWSGCKRYIFMNFVSWLLKTPIIKN